MTYPSSSPWGPHGPQVPSNSVTPNPTAPSAPYVPSPSAPAPVDYGTPRGPGGGSASTYSGPGAPPSPKSVVVAALLSLFIAPAGVFYATYRSRQFLPGMIYSGIATVLMVTRATLAIPIIVISLIWSVGAVRSYNRELEAQKEAAEVELKFPLRGPRAPVE